MSRRRIAGIVKFVFNKPRREIGFKIGNNLSVMTKERSMFKLAMRAALDKKDGVVKDFWDKNRLDKGRKGGI